MYPAGIPEVPARFVVLSSGIRVRIAESGPAAGPPVLLLHGWAASLFTYRHLVPALAQAGYRAIALDFRGHGLSDKPVDASAGFTSETLVADVLALLDALALDRADVIGHSMGGAVALQLAVRHPGRVSRLVLVNPAGLTRIWWRDLAAIVTPRMLDAFAPGLTPRWLVRLVLRWTYAKPDRLSERDVDQYWAPSQFSGYFHAARLLLRNFGWRPLPDVALGELRAPALVLIGADDRVIPNGLRGAQRLKDAELVVIADSGHLCIEERPDEANAVIARFLRAQPAA